MYTTYCHRQGSTLHCIYMPRCVGGGLQFVSLGRQSEMALQAGQLTLCGLNERFSPPVVMFLDSHPAGDQAPVLMVQVGRGVTKRCRLSWLTNGALVYKTKCRGRGGGVAGSQPMSTAVHRSKNKLHI
jgi:hypothetical protein